MAQSLEHNLNALEEMIFDENKLVTYTSLSKELCVHVNYSKTLLQTFLKKNPSKKLCVNYIISGMSDDYNAVTKVCTMDILKELKNGLKRIFFEHIYSITNGNIALDNEVLCTVNTFDDLSLCQGIISEENCLKRTTSEIESLKYKTQIPTLDNNANTHASIKIQAKPKEDKTNDVVKPIPVKSEPIINTNSSPKKLHGKSKSEIKNPKSIAGFFNKKTENTNAKINNDKPKLSVVEPAKEIKKEKPDFSEPIVSKPVKNNTVQTQNKEKNNKKESNNKQLNKIKKNAKIDKKRKRVLQVSDSESDEDPFKDDTPTAMETNDSDDEIPPTPDVSQVKITSGILNPKKRRKIVDKTYTDEDGYILTKKVEVYESCSDNEETETKENIVNMVKQEVKKVASPVKAKSEGAKNSKKKISPPQKGKQATMMNFFKKL